MEYDKYVLFKSRMKIHSIYSGYDITRFLANVWENTYRFALKNRMAVSK